MDFEVAYDSQARARRQGQAMCLCRKTEHQQLPEDDYSRQIQLRRLCRLGQDKLEQIYIANGNMLYFDLSNDHLAKQNFIRQFHGLPGEWKRSSSVTS